MDWTDQELDELATFLAKRMTPRLELLDPSDPPPPGDPARDWRTKLRTARDRGQLARLARAAAAVDPADENLQQACRLLDDGAGGRNTLQVLGAALSVGLALGVVLAGSAVGAALAAYGLPSSEPATVVIEPMVLARAEAPAEPPAPTRVFVDQSDEAPALDELAEVAPHEAPRAPGAPNPLARCGGGNGEVLGYWYAGTKRPGKAGDRIVLSKTVNVRADYPDVHNGFEKRSTVRCVLVEGDMVKLARDPVKVPGEAYWVPLVAGTVSAKAG